ncbi:TasA family protein [Aneurinibacillus sp. REN35]|uniref:TasA family protein n=1 Tax=Aneurinibacillus sp. REN35 TaxID=3237286 RepID=UPI003527535C
MKSLQRKLYLMLFSLLLGALLATGGTVAHFYDEEKTTGEFEAGHVNLNDSVVEQEFKVHNIQPGQRFDHTFYLENVGSLDGYLSLRTSHYSTSVKKPDPPGHGEDPGGEEPGEEEPGAGSWDKSSIQVGALTGNCDQIRTVVTNSRDARDMKGAADYYVYWVPVTNKGNAKDGKIVAQGSYGPLTSGQSHTITYQPRSNPNGAQGKYMVKVMQRPGHPGKGEAWSGQAVIASCTAEMKADSAVAVGATTMSESEFEQRLAAITSVSSEEVDLGTQIKIHHIYIDGHDTLPLFKEAAGIASDEDIYISHLKKPDFKVNLNTVMKPGTSKKMKVEAQFIDTNRSQKEYEGASVSLVFGFELMQVREE